MLIIDVLLIVLIAWTMLYYIYIKFRDHFRKWGVEIAPFALVWRIKSELKFLEKLAKKPIIKYYKLYSIIATSFCLLFSYYIIVTGFINVIGRPEVVTVIPYVPGLTVRGLNIFYSLIAIAIALVVHELSHGLVALAEDIPLRSTGILLLFIFPGAFIEPDKDSYDRSSKKTKLSILAAGSAANLIIAFIALILILTTTNPHPLITSTFNQTNGHYSALYVNNITLPVPSSIVAVNGTEIDSLERFTKILTLYKSESVTFNLTLFDYTSLTYISLLIHKPANISYLGVVLYPRSPNFIIGLLPIESFMHFVGVLIWIYIINFGLAIVNSAPLFITDGGRIMHEVILGGRKKLSYLIQGVTTAIFITIIIHGLLMYIGY